MYFYFTFLRWNYIGPEFMGSPGPVVNDVWNEKFSGTWLCKHCHGRPFTAILSLNKAKISWIFCLNWRVSWCASHNYAHAHTNTHTEKQYIHMHTQIHQHPCTYIRACTHIYKCMYAYTFAYRLIYTDKYKIKVCFYIIIFNIYLIETIIGIFLLGIFFHTLLKSNNQNHRTWYFKT